MYTLFKKSIRFLLPKKVVFKYEEKIRSIVYLFYKGDQFKCTICEKQLRTFISLKNGDQLCPNCGSLSRDRRLWQVVQNEFLSNGITILDFSPSRSLYRRFKQEPSIHYFSTDISGDFLADYHFDITKMDSPSQKYDLILCYHVLEHIEEDSLAMMEFYRILKENRTCLIQTPFKEGDIYEDLSITSESERLQHFGQEDHVRIYSVKGLRDRLTSVGFDVEIRSYVEKEDNEYGFKPLENILVGRK